MHINVENVEKRVQILSVTYLIVTVVYVNHLHNNGLRNERTIAIKEFQNNFCYSLIYFYTYPAYYYEL